MRVLDVNRGRGSGIHYAPPYPAIQDSHLKTEVLWDATGWVPALRQCHRVKLAIDSPWLNTFAYTVLSAKLIDYFESHAYRGSYNAGAPGDTYVNRSHFDCVLESMITADGKATVRVRPENGL